MSTTKTHKMYTIVPVRIIKPTQLVIIIHLSMINMISRNVKMTILHLLLKGNTNLRKSIKKLPRNTILLLRNSMIGKNTLNSHLLNSSKIQKKPPFKFKNPPPNPPKAQFQSKNKKNMHFLSIFQIQEVRKGKILTAKLSLRTSSWVNP